MEKHTIDQLYQEAYDACVNTEEHINNIFDHQEIGHAAIKKAYAFSVYCFDHPTKADTLDGWDKVTHQANTTYFRRALKFLSINAKATSIESKVSIWGRVFESAHSNGYDSDELVFHITNNGGMRAWYNVHRQQSEAQGR